MLAFSQGVSAYHQYPRPQRPPEPPVVARHGAARLLDYGNPQDASAGPTVLLIPSLINRAYILDLTEQRSLVRHMAQNGLRPLLVDWGDPGDTEASYDLAAYITGPLQHFYDISTQLNPAPPAVLGYCMGGLLALALAGRNSSSIGSLSLLATPWDFHAGADNQVPFLRLLKPLLEPLLAQLGHLPVDVLQTMFASLSPMLTGDKFRSFADLNPTGGRARSFVALEDWLNDGVPLVSAVARECLFDWYLENAPARGNWLIDGQPVSPGALTCPTLTLIPQQDHIVPPGSAQALADLLPDNQNRRLKAGHIGMVAGSHAKSTLYEPLVEWIRSQSGL
ncbi:MAG: alpha/beta fold hydrolase [Rhodospirillales bacterium]|nr:alpha/beta fold hydrolase [Rhodospirillales bacterium]